MAKEPRYNALLASNDSALSELVSTILLSMGFEVTAVKSRALRSAIGKDDYEVMVIDGDLPGPVVGNGSAVVVISPSDHVTAYDNGADLVIDKPIITNVFSAKLHSVARRYGIEL